MGVREILSALGRRWYIVVAGVLVSLGAGYYVFQADPPDYTARSLVLLLPPVEDEEGAGSNPFLQLGGLEVTARVLVLTYSSTSFAEEIKKVSPHAEVEVSMDDSTRGGVVAVDVKDRGDKAALDTLEYVTDSVSTRLAELQSEVGVADSALVRSMVLAIDTEAEPDYQSLIRMLVIVVGGGIAATLIVALLVDVAVMRSRRRRRGLSHGFAHRAPARAPKTAPAEDAGEASGRAAPVKSSDIPVEVDDLLESLDIGKRAPAEPRSAARGDSDT